MVSLGANDFILRMDQVIETLALPVIKEPGVLVNGCLQVRGELLPCLDLKLILGRPGTSSELRYVVVVRNGESKFGLIVDQLKGEIKAVIKPLGRFFCDVTTVSGATILGDGSIALFIETGKLIEHSGQKMLSALT
jgi:two-component system chemotaxis sensor kinase CheA